MQAKVEEQEMTSVGGNILFFPQCLPDKTVKPSDIAHTVCMTIWQIQENTNTFMN